MPYIRASSGLLRARIPLRPAVSPPRWQVRGVKDDLGGPYGQEPPKKSMDMLRRNWMPILGGVILTAIGYMYMWRGPEKVKDVPPMMKKEGEKVVHKIEDKGSEALAEVSSRTNKGGSK